MQCAGTLAFLSTLSLRRATISCAWSASKLGDFYPRSPCGERPNNVLPAYAACGISIHALLAESDFDGRESSGKFFIFLSTLSLRRATLGAVTSPAVMRFLSTLSLRRATAVRLVPLKASKFLSTLSLRRATDIACGDRHKLRHFYPRSPCGERLSPDTSSTQCRLFLSTLSLRRATPTLHDIFKLLAISIHALLAESDSIQTLILHMELLFLSTLSLRRATANWFDLWGWAEYFYPRSPCGERQPATSRNNKNNIFLSTLSLRRATNINRTAITIMQFLSTLSLRRATRGAVICYLDNIISIHALLAESDTWQRGSRVTYVISIHALLAESDSKSAQNNGALLHI